GPEPLHGTERNSYHEDRGQNLKSFLPRNHGPHQPEGHDDGRDGQNAPDHGIHVGLRQPSYLSQHVYRGSDCTPGNGSGVGYEIQRSGMERLEPKADHEGAGDGYGRAESSAAFNKSAKAEGHQQKLQSAVRGNTANGGFHDFKVSCAHRDVVEIDGS